MNADPEIDITKSNLEIPPPPNGPVSPYNEEIYDEEQSLTGKYGKMTWQASVTQPGSDGEPRCPVFLRLNCIFNV